MSEVVERRPRDKGAHIWKRAEHDWYQEPTDCTAALLEHERFVGAIHDPCCGGGNIVRTLLAAGYRATGSDIVERVPGATWFTGVADAMEPWAPTANVVSNPPFYGSKGTMTVIERGLAAVRGKLAIYTDARFLFSDERGRTLYADRPPTRLYFLYPRPSAPPGEWLAAGNKPGSGQHDFCWLVWDRTAPPAATTTFWIKRPGTKVRS